MPTLPTPLPIDEALPKLTARLREGTTAVLVAPPGAGKTTRVPLVLAGEPWVAGRRILVLEPRRIAARAAAARMAALLGEAVGETVGLRVRFGARHSVRTRIELVTEGVFTRLVLDDPGLGGIAAVLFDEFHERSLDADLGLALAREVQQALRPDLRLLVMSATLEVARIAALLGDAPVVASAGRSHPVETRHIGRDPLRPIEPQVAEVVVKALRTEPGSALVFLPGAAEIRRTERLLQRALSDPAIDLAPLYGALSPQAQDRAIAPAPPGRRKVVLASAIAETSLTIEGVRIIIDSGLTRLPRYEPDLGLTRLETVRVSQAAAEQRRGRAGRTAPGVCYRLWDEPQTAALMPFTPPEILSADLSGFVLDLADWGVSDPATLSFLDPPPQAALTEARALLRALGALDAEDRITAEGRALRRLPLPPRLARMLREAAREGRAALAAEIALILTERGLGGSEVDLRLRLDALRRERSARAADARRMAAHWAALAGAGTADAGADPAAAGTVLALAYPDRVARRRAGREATFLLANGRGASLDPASPLAREPFLAVAEVAGRAGEGRILLAAPIAPTEIDARLADRIATVDEVAFDRARAALRARSIRRLGAIVLSEQPRTVTPGTDSARVLADGILGLGLDRLPWTTALRQWRDRVLFLRKAEGEPWPDLSDAALAATAADWLVPALSGKTALADLMAGDLAAALQALLPVPLRRRLDIEAPTHLALPSGRTVAIDYQAEAGPTVAARLQEFFGLAQHPTIAGGRVALVLALLSPAGRPLQVTRDLPGFWRGSYAEVRAQMRGRYPKHPWPEDPLGATAPPRGTPRSGRPPG